MLKKLKSLYQVLRENPSYEKGSCGIRIESCPVIVTEMKALFGTFVEVPDKKPPTENIKSGRYWYCTSWFEEDSIEPSSFLGGYKEATFPAETYKTLKPLIEVLNENPYYLGFSSFDFKEPKMMSIIGAMIHRFGSRSLFSTCGLNIDEEGFVYHSSWFIKEGE